MLDIHSQLCYNMYINKGDTISSLFINNCSSLFNMNKVLIHLKQNAKNHLEDLGFKYQELDGELNVIVDDVPYTHEEQYYQDPDEQLCEITESITI